MIEYTVHEWPKRKKKNLRPEYMLKEREVIRKEIEDKRTWVVNIGNKG